MSPDVLSPPLELEEEEVVEEEVVGEEVEVLVLVLVVVLVVVLLLVVLESPVVVPVSTHTRHCMFMSSGQLDIMHEPVKYRSIVKTMQSSPELLPSQAMSGSASGSKSAAAKAGTSNASVNNVQRIVAIMPP